jgi:tetratricopeptide (TPR) repeat protein
MPAKLICLIGILLPMTAGCALFGRREPAASQIAAARQFSQEGVTAIEAGQWERAETLLRQALAASPDDAQSRRYLAEALWHRGAADEALTQIEAAADNPTSDAATAVRAGEFRFARRSWDLALARAEQAIRLDPELPQAWALRGRAFWRMNQPERALADFHHALALTPNDRQLLLDVAVLYRQIGQPARALTTIHLLVETYPPGDVPQQALYLEGVTLQALGRNQQAIESMLAASRRDPPNAEILFQLAQLYAATGDDHAAAAAARQALAVDPVHAGGQQLLQQLLARAAPSETQHR